MPISLVSQREQAFESPAKKTESQENGSKTPLTLHANEKITNSLNPIDSLLNKNFNAKKKLAKELSDMGISRDDIFRILHLED